MDLGRERSSIVVASSLSEDLEALGFEGLEVLGADCVSEDGCVVCGDSSAACEGSEVRPASDFRGGIVGLLLYVSRQGIRFCCIWPCRK